MNKSSEKSKFEKKGNFDEDKKNGVSADRFTGSKNQKTNQKSVKPSTQYKREHKADYGKEKIDILFEDEYICVINKPTGLLSCPYPGSRSRTAQSVLEDIMRKNGTFSAKHRPFVVHRLDRDTSGVMMFALTEAAQKKIMDTWHQMVTERLYRAVAENPKNQKHCLPFSGLIDDPLAFNAHNVGFVPKEGDKPRHDERFAKKHNENSLYEKNIEGYGENRHFKTVPARTNFTTILRGPTHTLFELSLDTGKKNQIRAHLASKGYPLAGDENFRANTDNFHRLCLHARTLEFTHPFTGEKLRFEVAEPEEWKKYVEKGDKHPEIPIWKQEKSEKEHVRFHKHANVESFDGGKVELGKKRLSAKDKAHMDFIQQGKFKGR